MKIPVPGKLVLAVGWAIGLMFGIGLFALGMTRVMEPPRPEVFSPQHLEEVIWTAKAFYVVVLAIIAICMHQHRRNMVHYLIPTIPWIVLVVIGTESVLAELVFLGMFILLAAVLFWSMDEKERHPVPED